MINLMQIFQFFAMKYKYLTGKIIRMVKFSVEIGCLHTSEGRADVIYFIALSFFF